MSGQTRDKKLNKKLRVLQEGAYDYQFAEHESRWTWRKSNVTNFLAQSLTHSPCILKSVTNCKNGRLLLPNFLNTANRELVENYIIYTTRIMNNEGDLLGTERRK